MAEQANRPDDARSGIDATGRIIPEVLRQHLEEFQFLWGQRQAALRSPDFTEADVIELEQRMEAHLDGLRVAGSEARPFLAANLAGEDGLAFGAAYALLQLNDEGAAEAVTLAFLEAEAEVLQELCDVLCHNRIGGALVERIRESFASNEPARSVAAAKVLAAHDRLEPDAERLTELLGNADPEIRRAAWQVTAIVDSKTTRAR